MQFRTQIKFLIKFFNSCIMFKFIIYSNKILFIQDMQLEIDILKETINVLKKDPDIDQSALSNRENAVIIDVLKNRCSLPLLLQKLQLSKSSYYYQEQSLQKEDKYTLLRVRVIELFTENKGRYGYRRINALLKRENIIA